MEELQRVVEIFLVAGFGLIAWVIGIGMLVSFVIGVIEYFKSLWRPRV